MHDRLKAKGALVAALVDDELTRDRRKRDMEEKMGRSQVVRSLAALAFALVAATVVLAGCGGSSGGSSNSTTAGSTGSAGAEGAEGGSGADTAAAKKALAPYEGRSFPGPVVTEPLKEKPSPDTTMTALQFPAPIGGVLAEAWIGAGKTAGIDIGVVKTGATATSLQAAAESVVAQSPEAVLLQPIEPSVIATQLEELHEGGTKIVGQGFAELSNGLEVNNVTSEQIEQFGRLFADWAVAKHGADANVLLLEHPEYPFSKGMKEAFTDELRKLCPECESTAVGITAEEASGSANKIVSALQADPKINQMVGISDLFTGLPAALDAAGLDVGSFVYPGEPQSLEYVKNGEIEGAIVTSFPYSAYTTVDSALRLVQGMEPTPGEQKGWSPSEILTEGDITFDLKEGWSPVPDVAGEFAKFWHVAK